MLPAGQGATLRTKQTLTWKTYQSTLPAGERRVINSSCGDKPKSHDLSGFHITGLPYQPFINSAVFSLRSRTIVHFSQSPQSGISISYLIVNGFFFGTLLIASNAFCSSF